VKLLLSPVYFKRTARSEVRSSISPDGSLGVEGVSEGVGRLFNGTAGSSDSVSKLNQDAMSSIRPVVNDYVSKHIRQQRDPAMSMTTQGGQNDNVVSMAKLAFEPPASLGPAGWKVEDNESFSPMQCKRFSFGFLAIQSGRTPNPVHAPFYQMISSGDPNMVGTREGLFVTTTFALIPAEWIFNESKFKSMLSFSRDLEDPYDFDLAEISTRPQRLNVTGISGRQEDEDELYRSSVELLHAGSVHPSAPLTVAIRPHLPESTRTDRLSDEVLMQTLAHSTRLSDQDIFATDGALPFALVELCKDRIVRLEAGDDEENIDYPRGSSSKRRS